ncbi:MAG: TolB family protein [Solirubrobacterales bacterium]
MGTRNLRGPLCLLAVAIVALAHPASSLSVPLPDNRAYEQVTPADKNGGDVGGPSFEGRFANAFGQSATDGDAIGYASFSSFADALGSELFTSYISTRSSTGWSTHAISPPAAQPSRLIEPPPFRAFAPDLSASVLEWKEPLLTPEAPPEYTSLYLRHADGSYRLLTETTPPNRSPDSYFARFAGATPDLSHVVFEADDALLPEAPAEATSVYEWSPAGLRLASVLPSGEAAPEAQAGSPGAGDYSEVISADGSRVFWTAEGQLYVREGGVRTVQLNASRREVSLGDGSADLLAISADGSTAFFSDATSLTDAPDDHGGLYEYDLDSESLRLLTPDPGGEPHIEGMLGASEDGSLAYFVSSAVLAPGAQEEAPNLYVSRAGALELVATLSGEDSQDWSGSFEEQSSRLTPDGRHLAFLSRRSLTGYDNTDARTEAADPELFVYEPEGDRLTCVSCNPSGARPIGPASLPIGTFSSYRANIFSADGAQVFFDSADALVPIDGNHRQDVYEFENGSPRLISTGTSSDISALVDVGGGGRDVFFTTRSQLVPSDRDDNADIYDARVGGGFPAPPPEPLPCTGEACRGPLTESPGPGSVPATAVPGTETETPPKRHARKRCHRHGHRAHRNASKRCGRKR